MKKLFIFFILFIFACQQAPAKHLRYEKEYQNHWCGQHKGQIEYRLDDKTRVDCLLPDYAVEVDFCNGSKVYEAIGQSLYYSLKTGKKAGILIIIENPIKAQKYLKRLMLVANKHKIKVWTITPADIPKTD